MNLIIDQGNSVCKVAVADGGELIAHYSFPQVSLREAGVILSDHPALQAAIYSSVAAVDKMLLGLLAERIPTVLQVDEHIAVPVSVAYDRKRLGSDRIAAVVGAHALAPEGVSLLVTDLGTAITYEQISPKGEYTGGEYLPRALYPTQGAESLHLAPTVDPRDHASRTRLRTDNLRGHHRGSAPWSDI